jgi:hypothetical protein
MTLMWSVGRKSMPRLLVFGDSLACCGPTGVVGRNDSRLYPHWASARLSEVTKEAWTAQVEVKPGWSIRDAVPRVEELFRQLNHDPDVGAVFLGLASMDSATLGLPPPLTRWLDRSSPMPLRQASRRNSTFFIQS